MGIKPEDLRVGNLVNTPNANQNPFRVDYFDKNKVYQENGTYDLGEIKDIPFHPLTWYIQDISPIPLTEEWLIRLGFNKKYKSYENGDFTFLQGGYDKFAYKLTIVENTPKYVHTLQNLYYALTGTELTIK